jgi:hypothetical protein
MGGMGHVDHWAVMLRRLAVCGRHILEWRGLEHRVVHDVAVGGGVRCRRAYSAGAMAPNVLELSGRNIGTVVGGNGGPELVAAGLVDVTKAVGVDDLGLMSDLGVDAQSVERLWRAMWGQRARLGQKDLVLNTSRGVGNRSRSNMRAAIIAHRRAVARGVRVRVVVH